MNNDNLNRFITEALAIEAEEAKKAGAIGFMARALVQATLPHSKREGNEFERKNGLFRLTILSPRLLVAWLTTEAVKTKTKEIILGHSLAKFMEQIDLTPTGGRWGTITRLRGQMKRLFSSAISCTYDDGEHWAIRNVQPVSKANLWWDPKNPDQASLFQSVVCLGDEFFNEAINSPVPIDMRVLKLLKRSPLALDIYCWLTYRYSYLRKDTMIPWGVLQNQFGADYAFDLQGIRNFKKAFIRELRKVYTVYPAANVEPNQHGLILLPSKSHITSS